MVLVGDGDVTCKQNSALWLGVCVLRCGRVMKGILLLGRLEGFHNGIASEKGHVV